jgi:transposase-like protein
MKWIQRFSKCAYKFRANNKRSIIKMIFVDETLVRINGQDHWLFMDCLRTKILIHMFAILFIEGKDYYFCMLSVFEEN